MKALATLLILFVVLAFLGGQAASWVIGSTRILAREIEAHLRIIRAVNSTLSLREIASDPSLRAGRG